MDLKESSYFDEKEKSNKYNLVVLDLETTGFDKYKDEIIQVSIIDQDCNTLLNEYCKPEYKTEWKEAEEVTGISPSMVADKKPFSHYAKTVEDILNSTDKILIYNAGFDAKFLHAKGLKFSDDIIVDVMLDFAEVYGEWNEYYGNYKWQKLGKAAEYYGYKFKAHDSLEDVKATLYVYECMTKSKEGINKLLRDKLYVNWVRHSTGEDFIIGILSRGDKFKFEYGFEIEDALASGFELFIPFDELDKVYESDNLFQIFSSRVPSSKRADINIILESYGLKEYNEFDLLKASGGKLPTDNIYFSAVYE